MTSTATVAGIDKLLNDVAKWLPVLKGSEAAWLDAHRATVLAILSEYTATQFAAYIKVPPALVEAWAGGGRQSLARALAESPLTQPMPGEVFENAFLAAQANEMDRLIMAAPANDPPAIVPYVQRGGVRVKEWAKPYAAQMRAEAPSMTRRQFCDKYGIVGINATFLGVLDAAGVPNDAFLPAAKRTSSKPSPRKGVAPTTPLVPPVSQIESASPPSSFAAALSGRLREMESEMEELRLVIPAMVTVIAYYQHRLGVAP